MLNSQQSRARSRPAAEAAQRLIEGRALSLGGHGGEMSVVSGRVWLTRAGDERDHVLGVGESIRIGGPGSAVVEALGRGAEIAWRPHTLAAQLRARVLGVCDRCWNLVDPLRRLGIGVVAALAALSAGVLVFGPVSEARARALATAPVAVLHNDASAGAAAAPRGSLANGSDSRARPRPAAKEAGRRAPGAA